MTETEAYIQLIYMVGIVLCLPYLLFRLAPALAKIVAARFFPPKFIDVEIVEGDRTIKKRISLEDDDELVSALLNVKRGRM